MTCHFGYTPHHAVFASLHGATIIWLLCSTPRCNKCLGALLCAGSSVHLLYHLLMGAVCASSSVAEALDAQWNHVPRFRFRVLQFFFANMLLCCITSIVIGRTERTKTAIMYGLLLLDTVLVLAWWRHDDRQDLFCAHRLCIIIGQLTTGYFLWLATRSKPLALSMYAVMPALLLVAGLLSHSFSLDVEGRKVPHAALDEEVPSLAAVLHILMWDTATLFLSIAVAYTAVKHIRSLPPKSAPFASYQLFLRPRNSIWLAVAAAFASVGAGALLQSRLLPIPGTETNWTNHRNLRELLSIDAAVPWLPWRHGWAATQFGVCTVLIAAMVVSKRCWREAVGRALSPSSDGDIPAAIGTALQPDHRGGSEPPLKRAAQGCDSGVNQDENRWCVCTSRNWIKMTEMATTTVPWPHQPQFCTPHFLTEVLKLLRPLQELMQPGISVEMRVLKPCGYVSTMLPKKTTSRCATFKPHSISRRVNTVKKELASLMEVFPECKLSVSVTAVSGKTPITFSSCTFTAEELAALGASSSSMVAEESAGNAQSTACAAAERALCHREEAAAQRLHALPHGTGESMGLTCVSSSIKKPKSECSDDGTEHTYDLDTCSSASLETRQISQDDVDSLPQQLDSPPQHFDSSLQHHYTCQTLSFSQDPVATSHTMPCLLTADGWQPPTLSAEVASAARFNGADFDGSPSSICQSRPSSTASPTTLDYSQPPLPMQWDAYERVLAPSPSDKGPTTRAVNGCDAADTLWCLPSEVETAQIADKCDGDDRTRCNGASTLFQVQPVASKPCFPAWLATDGSRPQAMDGSRPQATDGSRPQRPHEYSVPNSSSSTALANLTVTSSPLEGACAVEPLFMAAVSPSWISRAGESWSLTTDRSSQVGHVEYDSCSRDDTAQQSAQGIFDEWRCFEQLEYGGGR